MACIPLQDTTTGLPESTGHFILTVLTVLTVQMVLTVVLPAIQNPHLIQMVELNPFLHQNLNHTQTMLGPRTIQAVYI